MSSEMLLADRYLNVLHSRGQRKLPLRRVYRNMRRRGLFLKAYAKISQNAGATTVGTDPSDTIQGMSLARIDAIIERLREGTFRWKPSRRIYVLKSNGSRRPISIPSWSDKLVQEVIRQILEAYYEPQFRDSSHGFRPNRGCHTALRQIKRSWTGTKWFIEGDIQGCFDNLSQEMVLGLLGQQIDDRRFLKLVKGMLEAGYLDDWQYHRTYSGVPQGGIVSPILSNLVLHELDQFVEDELIPTYTSGTRRKPNPAYVELARAKQLAKAQDDRRRYRQLCRAQRQLPAGDPHDPTYRRLRYARYADDFLLGLVGSKTEAEAIKARVGQFLNGLDLTLSQEKTYVTHAGTDRARFLGHEITTAWQNTRLTKVEGTKRRALNGAIQLLVPGDVAQSWLRRFTKSGRPHHIGGYVDLSDFEIVETFGAQLRGLISYYALAGNLNAALGKVRWACMESARKTLAAKHTIRQASVSYRRYYRDGLAGKQWRHLQVRVERKDRAPLTAKCGETPLRTRKTAYSMDRIAPHVIAGTRSELLTRLLAGTCELCGQRAELEAHHVKTVKALARRWRGRRHKPTWVAHMIARRRKKVVVCHRCHQAITHGSYDGRAVNRVGRA